MSKTWQIVLKFKRIKLKNEPEIKLNRERGILMFLHEKYSMKNRIKIGM